MSPTKIGLDQHNLLHQHWPNDCCLCRKETEIATLRAEVKSLKDFQSELQAEANRLGEKSVCWQKAAENASNNYYDMQKELQAKVESLEKENTVLQRWVNDLQSGMYINCVYCGHRYGPKKNTPVAMADVLKKHIEICKKHPMSQLKSLLHGAEEALRPFAEIADLFDGDFKDAQLGKAVTERSALYIRAKAILTKITAWREK